MVILIIVVSLTLGISAICSLFEAILYSMRIATLEVQAKKSRLAARALKMKRNISEPISAILILNTVANTAGATVAGMYAVKVFGEPHVLTFSLVLTFAILFLSEILPKSVGAVHWRIFWPVIVWPITLVKLILYPLVKIAQSFANLFAPPGSMATITEDEIKALVRVGAKEGELSKTESDWVHNLIELEDEPIKQIMTPRTVMFTLEADLTVDKALLLSASKTFTRIPVYENRQENIVGYITLRDLQLVPEQNRMTTTLKALKRDIMYIPGNVNIQRLLMALLSKKEHIAIVIDEYGGVDGLVSLEDIVETILGTEIVDEKDKVADLQEFARNQNKSKP
ncbi:MAG: HlyC/CorC family transporter [Fibrobacteria bacterium]|nr:HlyC/CorC family transporter [Fibrobacteria bacterium]